MAYNPEEERRKEADTALAEHAQLKRESKSGYTQEKGELFCELISMGLNVKQALRHPELPSTKTTIYLWLHENPEFAELYRIAQRGRAEAMVEEMVEIADDASDDVKMGPNGPVLNSSSVNRSRLRIDTRKWIASKWHSERFGDKVTNEHTGAGGSSLGNTQIVVQLLPSGTVLPKEEQENQPVFQDGNVKDPDAAYNTAEHYATEQNV